MTPGIGASVNGKPPVSKTGTAGSIPAAPAMTGRENGFSGKGKNKGGYDYERESVGLGKRGKVLKEKNKRIGKDGDDFKVTKQTNRITKQKRYQ